MVVTLPFFTKPIFGISFQRSKRIGFEFTNQTIYNFRENVNINTSEDWERWIKENGQNVLVAEMTYGAAQAYCQAERKKQTFTKSSLTVAIVTADPETQKKIVDAWRSSQTFGVVEAKKKPIARS